MAMSPDDSPNNLNVAMLRVFLIFTSLIFATLVGSSQAEPVRVMTFNIRYGSADDGENSWPHRRELLIKVIRDFNPDILGVQEAERSQVDELTDEFPSYSVNGVGREADGGGEYSAIFYRRKRFDLCAAGTDWLSDTPAVPGSKSWGNNLPRIVTWMMALDRTNGRRFWVYNTHWDHQSQEARLKSGQLMAKQIGEQTEGKFPALVTGDFNAGEKNPAMPALTRKSNLLTDTIRAVHRDEKVVGTFNGFTGEPGPEKIDGIFTTREWQVLQAEIRRDHEGGRYPSDHFPVTATVSLDAADAQK
jgi:endonuclease/exonuclease/phosphatase family metal-dependent hydrolase